MVNDNKVPERSYSFSNATPGERSQIMPHYPSMVDKDQNNIAEEDLGNGEEMGSDNDDNEESSEGDDMDDFLDEESD